MRKNKNPNPESAEGMQSIRARVSRGHAAGHGSQRTEKKKIEKKGNWSSMQSWTKKRKGAQVAKSVGNAEGRDSDFYDDHPRNEQEGAWEGERDWGSSKDEKETETSRDNDDRSIVKGGRGKKVGGKRGDGVRGGDYSEKGSIRKGSSGNKPQQKKGSFNGGWCGLI